jgi:signal transduction histidine kinase
MHERAEELGGGCIVESTSEGGTRVLARLPLEKE